ncbi:MAG TPA: carbohydrate ABC transporter permease [Cellulomonas sp.]
MTKKRAAKPADDLGARSAISEIEWRRPRVRRPWRVMHAVLFVLLVIASIGPLVLLLKFAVTPSQDILRTPLAVFPHGVKWSNVSEAWNRVHISRYFLNSLIAAAGCWVSQIAVATSAGYVLSVLRPAWTKVLNSAILCTLFVPSVVLLVPLYLVVLHPPLIGHSMVNTFWGVWLPAGASAFNVVLMSRFFDSLPREVFEAARVDGAGPFRVFWSIVLPMSRPILGVVSVFAVIASWKDFLWPMLVLRNTNLQPLAVRLPALQASTDLGVLMAAMAIAALLPVVMFLVFQRTFLNSAGMGGAVKG